MSKASVMDHKAGGEHAFIDWVKKQIPNPAGCYSVRGMMPRSFAWKDLPGDCVATLTCFWTEVVSASKKPATPGRPQIHGVQP